MTNPFLCVTMFLTALLGKTVNACIPLAKIKIYVAAHVEIQLLGTGTCSKDF
jgi:hypothetical protein